MAEEKVVATAPAPAPAKPTSKSPDQAKGGSNEGFKATLSIFDMVVYGLIFMVPIAPFPIYASVFNTANGLPTLSYAVGMIAMLFTALSFGVMVPIFPSSGSIFVYTSKGVNKGLGYVTGWLMLLQYIITPDLMFIMAANSLQGIPGLEHVPIIIWCLIFLAFTTCVAIRGMGATIVLDRLALIGELIVLFLFIGFAFASAAAGHNHGAISFDAIYDPSKFSFQSMFSAISLCALSYVGFGSVATLTQESKAGPKGPGKAMIWILLVLGLLYCTMCFAATCADPTGSIARKYPTDGFYVLAGAVGGEWLMLTCEIANVLALGIFTGLAAQTSVSRILYIMGQTGAMPKRLGVMNNKRHTPVTAVLVVAILSLILLIPLIFVGQDTAAEFSNFGALSSYFLLNVCVLVYCWWRQKTKKVGRHLICPLIGCIFAGIFILTLDPIPHIVGVCWIIIGIVIYLIVTKKFHHVIDMGGTP